MIRTLVITICMVLMLNGIGGWEHKINKRQAVDDRWRWDKSEIPYIITARDFNYDAKKIIRKAMDNWEAVTCIKFVPYAAGLGARPRIVIGSRDKGCYAQYLGMLPGRYQPQKVNLASGCVDVHTVMHEMGHVIGLHHEQNRKDRDQYVTINFQNLMPSKTVKAQFEVSPYQSSLGVPYSYTSIMHYQKTFFQRGKGYLTIVPKNAAFIDIMGTREGLNFVDVEIVTKMYKCNAHCSTKQCPRGAMLGKNCRCWCKNKMYVVVDCETNKMIDTNMLDRRAGGRLVDSPSGTVRFFSSFKVNWVTAAEICKRMNGNLVSFNKHGKREEFNKQSREINSNNFNRKRESYWSSGNDINKEGKFEWGDGTLISNTAAWGAKRNNGGGNNFDCVLIVVAQMPVLIEYNCGLINKFVCEFEKGSCYDEHPNCKYWSKTNECLKPGIAKKCRFSCKVCGKREEEKGGGPSEKVVTTTTRKVEIVTEMPIEEEIVTEMPIEEEVVTQRPQRPSTPTAVRPNGCIKRECWQSFVTSGTFRNLPKNAEFCVECGECQCLRQNIYGFGVYMYLSNVCCAIKQITGKSKGKTTLIRRGAVQSFQAGERNGIRSSEFPLRQPYAFEVKGWNEAGSRDQKQSCVSIPCRTTLNDQTWYNTLDKNTKFCVKCPQCACRFAIIWGFGKYTDDSDVCCAAKQMKGITIGKHEIIKAPGLDSYSGGVRYGIRSQSYDSPWTGTLIFSNVKINVKDQEEQPTCKQSITLRGSCTTTLSFSFKFLFMDNGKKLCFRCPACACRRGSYRIFGFGTYNTQSTVCCAIKQMTGDSKGVHTLEKQGVAFRLIGGMKNGVTSQPGRFAVATFKVIK